MKKIGLFLMSISLVMFMACAPTIVTKSISETTGPNGEKTVTVHKSISQHISITQQEATDDAIDSLNKK